MQLALREILPDSTTLIIAHRPSTAALADVVAVLDEGRIVARGTHEELLETSPLYRELMGAGMQASASARGTGATASAGNCPTPDGTPAGTSGTITEGRDA
ncbi:drugs-transport transmembrane ATP-binding protein ABC transporter [Mycobacteroides abscessus subsp. abscessus]|nr:drugs-transport transmembrane ATP-binding protein ABC transporter [Mycobacteroides abscessus subsp. abscessus]